MNFHCLLLLLALLPANPPATRATDSSRSAPVHPFLPNTPSLEAHPAFRLQPPLERRWWSPGLPGSLRSPLPKAWTSLTRSRSSVLPAHTAVGKVSGGSHWTSQALEGKATDTGIHYNPVDTTQAPTWVQNCSYENRKYCLNNGTCLVLTTNSSAMFCNCRVGYTGPRCQEREMDHKP